MGESGVDIVSVDWTVDMADARRRLGPDIAVQGNVDPAVLFGSKELIRDRHPRHYQESWQSGAHPQPGPRHPAWHP